MTNEQLFEIVRTALHHSEKRIATNAAKIAVSEMIAYLQAVGVLDSNAQPTSNMRLKVRYINPNCYPPLWID